MRYSNKDFAVDRNEFYDILIHHRTKAQINLLPGELEKLFEFLGMLYLDVGADLKLAEEVASVNLDLSEWLARNGNSRSAEDSQ